MFFCNHLPYTIMEHFETPRIWDCFRPQSHTRKPQHILTFVIGRWRSSLYLMLSLSSVKSNVPSLWFLTTRLWTPANCRNTWAFKSYFYHEVWFVNHNFQSSFVFKNQIHRNEYKNLCDYLGRQSYKHGCAKLLDDLQLVKTSEWTLMGQAARTSANRENAVLSGIPR